MQINPKAGQAQWVTLVEGAGKTKPVRILMAPAGDSAYRRALARTRETFPDFDIETGDRLTLIDLGDEQGRNLVRECARDWEGLFVDGAPLAFSPAALDMALADEDSGFMAAVTREWLDPLALRRAEKNALSASPGGTGKAGTRAKTIAGSPAKPKRKAGAKPAPTASTN